MCAIGVALGFIVGLGLFIQIHPLVINKEIIQGPINIFDLIVKNQSKVDIKRVSRISIQIISPDHIRQILISTNTVKCSILFGDWYRQKDLHSILDHLKIVVNETKFVYKKYNP
jgi:hypothetical protein